MPLFLLFHGKLSFLYEGMHYFPRHDYGMDKTILVFQFATASVTNLTQRLTDWL